MSAEIAVDDLQPLQITYQESLQLNETLRTAAALVHPSDDFKEHKFYPEQTARQLAWWSRELLLRLTAANDNQQEADRMRVEWEQPAECPPPWPAD